MTTLPLAQVCCAPLMDGPLSAGDAVRLAGLFKAVADPARLRLLSLIAAQPDGQACTCDLTEPVGLSQPTVSHHLKVLLDAGLLSRDKRAQWSYYRIVPEQLAALRSALDTPVGALG